MSNNRIVYFIIMGITLRCGTLFASEVLRVSNQRLNIGIVTVGEKKERILAVKNVSSRDVRVDKVVSSCSCLQATIDPNIIKTGESADLKIALENRYPHKFSYQVAIIPRGHNKQEPLKIEVCGEAKSTVSARVGWVGGILQKVTYPKPVDLGIRHKSATRPVVLITTNDRNVEMKDFIVDANSGVFKLERNCLKDSVNGKSATDVKKKQDQLRLTLKPKKILNIGRLMDIVRISFADGSKLYIQISCRIVGDVYAEKEIIHMGRLSECGPQKFTIYFADHAKVWQDLQWDIKGYLSDAIAIRNENIVHKSSHIEVKLEVDRSRLSSIPKGYVFCRIKFYQKDNPDEAVDLLVNGLQYRI